MAIKVATKAGVLEPFRKCVDGAGPCPPHPAPPPRHPRLAGKRPCMHFIVFRWTVNVIIAQVPPVEGVINVHGFKPSEKHKWRFCVIDRVHWLPHCVVCYNVIRECDPRYHVITIYLNIPYSNIKCKKFMFQALSKKRFRHWKSIK